MPAPKASKGTLITSRLREEAALICQVTASDPSRHRRYAISRIFLAASNPAFSLALCAAMAARNRLGRASVWSEVVAAEAEALLRTGFVPAGWRRSA